MNQHLCHRIVISLDLDEQNKIVLYDYLKSFIQQILLALLSLILFFFLARICSNKRSLSIARALLNALDDDDKMDR